MENAFTVCVFFLIFFPFFQKMNFFVSCLDTYIHVQIIPAWPHCAHIELEKPQTQMRRPDIDQRPTFVPEKKKKKFPFPSEFYHQKMSRKNNWAKDEDDGKWCARFFISIWNCSSENGRLSVSWIIEMLMRIRSCCQSGLGTREKCHEWVMDDSREKFFPYY